MVRGIVSKSSREAEVAGECLCPWQNSPVKVMLVDDGEQDRQAMSLALRSRSSGNCEIKEFSCGTDALRAFQRRPSFDVAVVDYKMPDMDGLSLVAELKRLSKTLVAVLVTGYDSEDLANSAKNHGCDGYLSKSISGDYLSELSVKIEECLALVKERQLTADNLRDEFLEKTEDVAGAAFNVIGMPSWAFDLRTGKVQLGPLWQGLIGKTGCQVSSLRSLLRQLVHPSDLKDLRQRWRALRKNPKRLFNFECRVKTASGDWRWFASIGRAMKCDAKGRPIRMLGACKDIDRRRREGEAVNNEKSKYEGLVNSIDGILWEFDAQAGLFTFVSRKAERILGYPERSWLSERGFLERIAHPSDKGKVKELFSPRTDVSSKGEFRVLAADGHEVWLGCLSNSQMPSGRNCGILIDISARIAIEYELKCVSREMAKANEELLEYARTVSHDLKSPLRAIHGYSSFLQEDLAKSLTQEQAGYFSSMNKAVIEAGLLIDGLMRISKVSTHKMEWSPIDVGQLLKDTLATMRIPQNANISMPKLWPVIVGEPLLFKQIFQNLIDNAIKFNKSECRKVWLEWSETTTSWEINVADNGIGIAKEHAERVFGAFERLNRVDFEGSGVGLTIVKRAVQKLSGSICVRARKGGGSKFEIILPKHRLDKKGLPLKL